MHLKQQNNMKHEVNKVHAKHDIPLEQLYSPPTKIDVEHFITLQYFLLHYNFETTLGTRPHGLIYIYIYIYIYI
jgi:hypothetical protein